MANIRQRGANSWQIRVDGPRDAFGERTRAHKTVKIKDPYILASKRRLQQHLNALAVEFEKELAAGDVTTHAPVHITCADFAARWLQEHVHMNLELRSQSNYGHFLNRWVLPRLGKLYMHEVQPMHITRLLADMRKPGAGLNGKTLGDASVMYCYRVMRSMFATAADWGVIATSPMAGIRKPRETARPDVDFYDETELAAMGQALATEREELRAMVLLAVMGGLRRAEMAGLQWQHVDFKTNTLSIRQSIPMYKGGKPHIKAPKTRSSARRIVMPQALVAALAAHRQTQPISMYRPGAEAKAPDDWNGPGDFVFCHPSGRPLDPQRLHKWWQQFCQKHGLRHIRLHDLRHTAATWLIRQNKHPKVVANMLGHAQIRTSMDTYGHLMPALFAETAAAMDDMPLGPQGVE